ncbi:hypothetical protein IFR05_008886 [Cadophora sp. M221]|nr:hypothetical protein IFR05_008886 [Cadophora sp. M221]
MTQYAAPVLSKHSKQGTQLLVLGNFGLSLPMLKNSVGGLSCQRIARGDVEDVGSAEVGAAELGNFRPTHEFVDGEELEELRFEGHMRVAGISILHSSMV